MQTLVHACLGSWVAGLLDLLGSCVPGLLRLPWVPGLLGCWVARSPGFLGSWVAMVTLDSWVARSPGFLGCYGSCACVWGCMRRHGCMQRLVHACLGSWVAGLLGLLGSCVPGLLWFP